MKKHAALFALGFRPFFIGASIFAIISMSLWFSIYLFQLPLAFNTLTYTQWHGHEMIYGYGIAVIAGFLLTAIKNWTGIQTLHGKPLMGLFSLWVMARFLLILGDHYLILAGFLDCGFIFLLGIAASKPIIQVKQWRQLLLLLLLSLLIIGNILFYLGGLTQDTNLINISLYGGLYLIIGLITVLSRRVVPFFIERGVGYPITLFNHQLLDASIIITLLGFLIFDQLLTNTLFSSIFSGLLFFGYSIRLIGWHTHGIWKNPLLWSLYLSLWSIALGFLLFSIMPYFNISKSIALHTFAIGGIGLMTLGMMARISLGHTGRNIHQDLPHIMKIGFYSLLLAMIVRVILPLAWPTHYLLWIVSAQILWIIAFAIFAISYIPILSRPRIDNLPG